MHIYTYCVLNAYTVSLNYMQRVKRSCAYKLFNAVLQRVKILLFKKAEITRKIKESEFPGNMHICTLFPKCLQSFTKLHTAVYEKL